MLKLSQYLTDLDGLIRAFSIPGHQAYLYLHLKRDQSNIYAPYTSKKNPPVRCKKKYKQENRPMHHKQNKMSAARLDECCLRL